MPSIEGTTENPQGGRRGSRRPRLRDLMLGVAAIAVLLAVVIQAPIVLVYGVLALIGLAPPALSLLLTRGRRRPSGWCFGVATAAVLLATIGSCVGWLNFEGEVVTVPLSYVGAGAILGFGAIWAVSVARTTATPRRDTALAAALVLALVAAAMAVPSTRWPLRLAAIASRPALDRLADRVVAGRPVSRPERAGLFLVVASDLDPATGNAALVVDPDPNGRTGFVRLGASLPNGPVGTSRGPFYNHGGGHHMIGRWWYLIED